MKTGKDFREVFPQMDDGFRDAVLQGLANTEKEREPMKKKISVGAVLLAAIVMMAAVGVAAVVGRWSLLDMVMVEGLNIQPEETQQVIMTEVVQRMDENECATLVIREAVFDGIYAYLVADITPKDPQVLMVPEWLDPEKDFINRLDNRITEEMTIVQWAKEHGFEKLLLFNGVGGTGYQMNKDGGATVLEVRNSEPRMPMDASVKETYHGELIASLRWYRDPLSSIEDVKAPFVIPNSSSTVQVTTSINTSDFGGLIDQPVQLQIVQTDFTDYMILRSVGEDFGTKVGPNIDLSYSGELLDVNGGSLMMGAIGGSRFGSREMLRTVNIVEVSDQMSVRLKKSLYEHKLSEDNQVIAIEELSREEKIETFDMGETVELHFDKEKITQRSMLDEYFNRKSVVLAEPVVFEEAGITLEMLRVNSYAWDADYELDYSVQPVESEKKKTVYKQARFDILDPYGNLISTPKGVGTIHMAKGSLAVSTIPDTLDIMLTVFDAKGMTKYGPVTVQLIKE